MGWARGSLNGVKITKHLLYYTGVRLSSFVQRGISSAEALEVMSKNRTAVYPPFPPCPVRHLALFAPHVLFFLNLLCCLCLSIVSISCLPSHFAALSSRSPFVCSLYIFFLLDLSVHMVVKKLFFFCFVLFFKRNVLGIKRLVPL